MTMNKKEKAAFDAAIERAEMLVALRWTCPQEKDIPVPKVGWNEGYDYNLYTKSTVHMWSSAVHHGDMPYRELSGSQQPCQLFSSGLLALKALRHEVEKEAAKNLLAIDKRINALETR